MDEMLTGYRMHITIGRLQQSFNQLGKVHRVTIQKSPKKNLLGPSNTSRTGAEDSHYHLCFVLYAQSGRTTAN